MTTQPSLDEQSTLNRLVLNRFFRWLNRLTGGLLAPRTTDLHFNRQLEQEFQHYYRRKHHKNIAISILIITLLFLLSLFIDKQYTPIWPFPILCRVVVLVAAIAAIMALYWAKTDKITQFVSITMPLVLALSVIVLAYHQPQPLKSSYYNTVVIVLMYMALFSRIHFKYYLISALFILLAINIAHVLDPAINVYHVLNTNYIFVGGFVFALLSAYFTEKTIRTYFIYNNKIREEQRKLAISESYIHNVVNAMANMLVVLDPKGHIVKTNPATQRALGYSSEELLQQPLAHIFQTPEIAQTILTHALQEKKPLTNMEAHLATKTGHPLSVIFSSTAFFDEDGQLQGITCIAQDITKQKQAEDEIRELAYYDSLTKLPNRTTFENKIEHTIAFHQKNKQEFALLFIDIDNFKGVNDTLGHHAGDTLLKNVAHNLRSNLRAQDFIARIGGDEFSVILSSIDSIQAVSTVAQKLIRAIDMTYSVFNSDIHTSVSVGIALYPSAGSTGSELAKHADIALYRAKQNGRNTYQYFTESLHHTHTRRMRIENALHLASAHEEFSLVYQPQFHTQTLQLSGIEVLIRWHHPELGALSPMEFLPIAEQTRQIIPIGNWVLYTALAQYHRWLEQFPEIMQHCPIAVNLSAVQIIYANITEDIQQGLNLYQLRPEQLEVELTETAIMSNYDKARETLTYIHELGCKIAIDDFGTGYSSLNQLKNLPIDILKIDRDFIKGIPAQHEDEIIVNAIVQLANNLNLDMIAEGIETNAQYRFLRQVGCHHLQGYGLCHPVTAKELTVRLERYAKTWGYPQHAINTASSRHAEHTDMHNNTDTNQHPHMHLTTTRSAASAMAMGNPIGTLIDNQDTVLIR